MLPLGVRVATIELCIDTPTPVRKKGVSVGDHVRCGVVKFRMEMGGVLHVIENARKIAPPQRRVGSVVVALSIVAGGRTIVV